MNLEKGGKRMIDLEKRAKAWDEFSGEAREFTIGDTFNSAYELGVRDGAASVPRWTRVEDGLPEKDGHYICTMQRADGFRYTYPKFYEVGTDMWADLSRNNVIAWMPLPQPYTEEQDEQR